MHEKILVVDDEQDVVDLISYNLKRRGYEVIASNNGLEALSRARQSLPDLIVLDLMMEGIDGLSVCEILRSQPSTKSVPIIILTAAVGEMARLNSLASGADDFLTKPFSPAALVTRVGQILQMLNQKRHGTGSEATGAV